MPGFPAYGTGPQSFDPLKTNNTFWGMFLVEAVRDGSIPEPRVDDMVTRLMSVSLSCFSFYATKFGCDSAFPIGFLQNGTRQRLSRCQFRPVNSGYF